MTRRYTLNDNEYGTPSMNISGIIKASLLVLFIGIVVPLSFCSFEKVPAGSVGVKVYLLGNNGDDVETLPVGMHWIGPYRDLFLFPTYAQNHVWEDPVPFQDKNGTYISAKFGITYGIDPAKVTLVFQKYRRGVEEITDVFLRNYVRDATNRVASKLTIDEINGEKKEFMIAEVQRQVAADVGEIGIVVDKIYLVGAIDIQSESVRKALNLKIEATQRAQQRENELREAEAEAKKILAQADGEAKGITVRAEAQARANKILSESITPELINYESAKRWDGKLPQVTGNATPFINLTK